jgi:hypothetical protein
MPLSGQMASTPKSNEALAQAITRLVDDSLSHVERPVIEAWVAATPEVAIEVALQRRVARDLRTGGPPVPQPLIAAVDARAGAVGRSHPRHVLPRPARRSRTVVAAVASVTLAAVVVGVTLGVSTRHPVPSIALASRLVFAPATEPAPPAHNPKLLGVSYVGITFPNYARQFGAVPTGRRADRLAGRPALTVFYRLRGGARLSYTVYSGDPVPAPRSTRSVVFGGVPLHLVTTEGLAVVTLVRHGHTCVLAGLVRPDVVLALAAAPFGAQKA